MNIIAIPYDGPEGCFYFRPDTTLNRDCENYYCPESVTSLSVTPAVYIRVDRAGKAIAAKFARRYYSRIGYGLNITASSLIDENVPQSFCMANSLDNTTYLSELFTPEAFPIKELNAETKADITTETASLLAYIDKKIEEITPSISVRTGDYIVFELSPTRSLGPAAEVRFMNLLFSVK